MMLYPYIYILLPVILGSFIFRGTIKKILRPLLDNKSNTQLVIIAIIFLFAMIALRLFVSSQISGEAKP